MEPWASDTDTPSHGLFSPEGVRLDLPIAGPAPRIFAYSIDFLIVVLLIFFLAVVLFATLPLGKLIDKWFATAFQQAARAAKTQNGLLDGTDGLIFAVFVLVQFTVETGYFIFWEMVMNGRSPGKALAGLRVVRRNGLPIDLRSSVVRNVMRIVDILPADYVVGLVSMVLSPGGERLGDHVAGTIVIRLDRPEAAPEIEASEEAAPISLTRQQLARIGPRELQLVRGTLRRAGALSQERRGPLLFEVAETLRRRLELAELPSPDHLAFLRDLLTVAERYRQNRSD